MTVHVRHRTDLAIGIATLVCVAVVLVPAPAWLRLAFAFPLMFVLPGWAIWRAVDIGDREDPLRTGAYAVGLSLSVSVLAAVALAAPGLISPASYALLVGVIGVGAVAAAVVRGRDAEPRPRPGRPPWRERARRVGWAPVVAVGVALLLVAGAVGLARTPLPVPDDRGFTELSFGPTPRGATEVDVRVVSSEADEREFSLRIARPGGATEFRPLNIAPGQTVVETVRFSPKARGTLRVALLEPTAEGVAVYRRIRLGLPTVGPAPRSQDVDDQP